MLKPVATLAAVGILGVVTLKMLGILLLPLLGMLLGLVFTVLKITLVIALVWWGFNMFRKWTERGSEA
jgi:threonine/homoserine/homoserine lactone efflux protein